MSRTLLATLLLAVVLVVPTVLADSPGDDRQMRRQEAMQRWEGLNGTQRQMGMDHAESHGLFARLAYDNATNTATGRWLSFGLQPSTGVVTDLDVRAGTGLVPLLSSVTPSAFTWQDGPTVQGANLRLAGTTLDFSAHNNPTVAMQWRAASNVTLTFNLASGLQGLFFNATNQHEVRVPVGVTHAHIATDAKANLTLDASKTVVTVQLAAGDSVMLRLHPLACAPDCKPDPAGGGLHDLLAAFEHHRLGAFLRTADADGKPLDDGETGDVHASTRSLVRGHVVWDISSDQHAGRVLFLTVDNSSVDMARLSQLTLTLNNSGLQRLDSVAAVVASAGTQGVFAMVPSADGQTVTIAVLVPHFSSYALALVQTGVTGSGGSTAPDTSTVAGATGSGASSSGAPGLEASALLLVLAGLALLLRRKA